MAAPQNGQVPLYPNDQTVTVDCMLQGRFGAHVILKSLIDDNSWKKSSQHNMSYEKNRGVAVSDRLFI